MVNEPTPDPAETANDQSRYSKTLAWFACALTLLTVAVVFVGLTSVGSSGAVVIWSGLLLTAPFIALAVWRGIEVRRQARAATDARPGYLGVLGWTAQFLGLMAMCALVIGTFVAANAMYGEFILGAVIMFGGPPLAICLFLFSWVAWLYGKRCLRRRPLLHVG